MDTTPTPTPTLIGSQFDINGPGVAEAARKIIAPKNATDEEFELFRQMCIATGLNPFMKEIWFIKTEGYTNKRGERVDGRVQIMIGINGYLKVANSQPVYDGMDEPVFEYNDKGLIIKCTVRVWRKDRSRPSTGVAFWDEYYPGPTPSGKPGIWDTKGHVMLAKVAKSVGIREAFIHILGGTYTQEEMDQAEQQHMGKVRKFKGNLVDDTIPWLEDQRDKLFKHNPLGPEAQKEAEQREEARKLEQHQRGVTNMVAAYKDLGINEAQLRELLKLDDLSYVGEPDLDDLRRIYTELKTGEKQASEYFLEGLID